MDAETFRTANEEVGLSARQERHTAFADFVVGTEPSLRQLLTAALGPELGREATAEALAYGWEHWDRVGELENPGGYLYRVGLNWGRKRRKRRTVLFPAVHADPVEWIEPGLPAALSRLSKKQRIVIYLVHGHDWSLSEVAEMLGVSKGTVQTHMERGMRKLRRLLDVEI